jgi:itaconate CoA-transferase
MYKGDYQKKLTTPAKAVEHIAHGSTVVHGMGTGEPPALLGALADRVRAGDLNALKVFSLLPMEHVGRTLLAPDLSDRLSAYCWFVTATDRKLVECGLNHFVPNEFHQIPRLIRDFMKVDVTVTTVSPMDQAGFFSFGTVNDFISTAARHSKRLIVEVNRHMPRVFGDSLLHVSEVDAIVENDQPLMETVPAEPKPEAETIGHIIAEMVPDGATLQLGIGGIPNAVCLHLESHKDLGIHTELFCPGMMHLIKKGVITAAGKISIPASTSSPTPWGTGMFEFMHDNPSMESYPVSYTNDPHVIAQNDHMISINSTIEVDILGQCNSEYLRRLRIQRHRRAIGLCAGGLQFPGGEIHHRLLFHGPQRRGFQGSPQV